MKLIQAFIAACIFLPILSQRTFLDNFALRPTFRRIREIFLNMNKNPSAEEAYRINLRNGVSANEFELDSLRFIETKKFYRNFKDSFLSTILSSAM